MLQVSEFNQGLPELPEGKVTVPKLPSPEVLQAITSAVGVSNSSRKTTAIYTRRKTIQERNNTMDIYDEDVDINHADSANIEPIIISRLSRI